MRRGSRRVLKQRFLTVNTPLQYKPSLPIPHIHSLICNCTEVIAHHSTKVTIKLPVFFSLSQQLGKNGIFRQLNRGVFKTQSKIYDGAYYENTRYFFLRNQASGLVLKVS